MGEENITLRAIHALDAHLSLAGKLIVWQGLLLLLGTCIELVVGEPLGWVQGILIGLSTIGLSHLTPVTHSRLRVILTILLWWSVLIFPDGLERLWWLVCVTLLTPLFLLDDARWASIGWLWKRTLWISLAVFILSGALAMVGVWIHTILPVFPLSNVWISLAFPCFLILSCHFFSYVDSGDRS